MDIYKGKTIKFILKIDDEEIEVPASIMVHLASNHEGCLGHFLAGYFKSYPTEEELCAVDYPWYKSDYGIR